MVRSLDIEHKQYGKAISLHEVGIPVLADNSRYTRASATMSSQNFYLEAHPFLCRHFVIRVYSLPHSRTIGLLKHQTILLTLS